MVVKDEREEREESAFTVYFLTGSEESSVRLQFLLFKVEFFSPKQFVRIVFTGDASLKVTHSLSF